MTEEQKQRILALPPEQYNWVLTQLWLYKSSLQFAILMLVSGIGHLVIWISTGSHYRTLQAALLSLGLASCIMYHALRYAFNVRMKKAEKELAQCVTCHEEDKE